MAKPIEIGLVLEGQDAVDFEEYLNNPIPTFTKEGIELMRDVAEELKTHPAKTGESALPNTGDSNAQNTLPPAHDSRIAARIRIGDTSNFMFSFAGCCNPQPGDEVVGYVSRGRGIIVHKENCRNLWKIQQIEKRMLQLEWEILDKKKK